MTKPCLNVAIVGCSQTGKTTLTAAILAVLSHMNRTDRSQIDKLDASPEERQRGITVHGNHVEYDTEHYHVIHHDTPAYPEHSKNIMLGLVGADAVIFVTNEKILEQRKAALQNEKLCDPEGFFQCVSYSGITQENIGYFGARFCLSFDIADSDAWC
jgi:translation elongation factor EF-1alpha